MTENTLRNSSKLKSLYDQDGFYIHTKSVLPPEILVRAANGLTQVRAGVFDTNEKPDGCNWKPGDDPHKLCKIEQPQLASSALREVLCSPLFGQLAGEITGAKMVQVWWVQGLYKPGSTVATSAGNVGWHQDESYWASWEKGSELFTAWLALSDVLPESGPMAFVQGSHLWGKLEGGNFFSQDLKSLQGGIKIPENQTWREVADLMPPGGVSFHHRMLLHGSHQNISSKPRLSLAVHLRTENSKIDPKSNFARFLNRPEICPIIFEKK